VWTNLFAEIDDGNGSAAAQVNDMDGASVRAGLAYPRVAIDGNVAEAAVAKRHS
jgi:hypothetical protein